MLTVLTHIGQAVAEYIVMLNKPASLFKLIKYMPGGGENSRFH